MMTGMSQAAQRWRIWRHTAETVEVRACPTSREHQVGRLPVDGGQNFVAVAGFDDQSRSVRGLPAFEQAGGVVVVDDQDAGWREGFRGSTWGTCPSNGVLEGIAARTPSSMVARRRCVASRAGGATPLASRALSWAASRRRPWAGARLEVMGCPGAGDSASASRRLRPSSAKARRGLGEEAADHPLGEGQGRWGRGDAADRVEGGRVDQGVAGGQARGGGRGCGFVGGGAGRAARWRASAGCSRVKGLLRWASMPAAMQRSRSPDTALAVGRSPAAGGSAFVLQHADPARWLPGRPSRASGSPSAPGRSGHCGLSRRPRRRCGRGALQSKDWSIASASAG